MGFNGLPCTCVFVSIFVRCSPPKQQFATASQEVLLPQRGSGTQTLLVTCIFCTTEGGMGKPIFFVDLECTFCLFLLGRKLRVYQPLMFFIIPYLCGLIPHPQNKYFIGLHPAPQE